jgi:hypothetical protein
MSPRHTAALAFVGWYLLLPPLGPGGGVDTTAPFSQWERLGAIDTSAPRSQWDVVRPFNNAAHCDRDRDLKRSFHDEVASHLHSLLESDEQLTDKEMPEREQKIEQLKLSLDENAKEEARRRSAICVSADDVRLKK